jgi:sortase (surface protein transpeptidase)
MNAEASQVRPPADRAGADTARLGRGRATGLIAVAGAVLTLTAAALAGCGRPGGAPAATVARPAASSTAPTPPRRQPATARPVTHARPLTVRIPAIGVTSSLVPLRLDHAGALQPPDDFVHAGWYAGGPTPGEQGPAVIAGHVDSRAGPAIFFRLRELRPGDTVLVSRSDRRAVRFRVVEVQRYPKNAFPAARVYQPTPDAALRLITCGGSFDYARRSYRDNIVVYAVAG